MKCKICGKPIAGSGRKMCPECAAQVNLAKEEAFNREKEKRSAVCTVCGTPVKHSNIKFCSKECRQKKKEQPNLPTKVRCPICGKIFEARNNKRFCSVACRAGADVALRTIKQKSVKHSDNIDMPKHVYNKLLQEYIVCVAEGRDIIDILETGKKVLFREYLNSDDTPYHNTAGNLA